MRGRGRGGGGGRGSDVFKNTFFFDGPATEAKRNHQWKKVLIEVLAFS